MSVYDLFPLTSEKNWKWAPIYIEPIVGSGERINIAIAIKDLEESYIVARTFTDDKLVCMFGKNSEKIRSIIEISIESMETNLKDGKEIEKWVPPLNGFFLGAVRDANNEDIAMVTKNAILLTSSIGSIKAFENIKEIEFLTSNHIFNERWSTQIKNETVKYNDEYEKAFSFRMEFNNTKYIKYDFLYGSYVSNFGLIIPGRFSVSIKDSKSKAFDLEYLMDTKSIFKPEKYELIIGMPRKDDPTINSTILSKIENTFSIIHDYGKKHRINIVRAFNAEEAAKAIIAKIA